MRSLLLVSTAISAAAFARAAPAQQPKPVAPVVVQPVKPVQMPAATKAQPAAAPAKTAARKYPVVITTPTLDVEISAKGYAPGAFKPVTITTPELDVLLAGPAPPPTLAPFTPRSIKTDSITVILSHP